MAFGFWLLAFGCSQRTPEQQAMETALESYEALIAGNYEAFLLGRAHMDSIPDSFREQLLVSYKQFLRQQQAAHQGISAIEATRSQTDSLSQTIQVFLMVHYADSTMEEIVVPMVECNGEWKMK